MATWRLTFSAETPPLSVARLALSAVAPLLSVAGRRKPDGKKGVPDPPHPGGTGGPSPLLHSGGFLGPLLGGSLGPLLMELPGPRIGGFLGPLFELSSLKLSILELSSPELSSLELRLPQPHGGFPVLLPGGFQVQLLGGLLNPLLRGVMIKALR